MKRRLSWVLIAAAVLISTAAALVPHAAVHADVASLTVNTECTTLPSYNGNLVPLPGTYDLYARLGRRGDQAQVYGYTQVLGQTGVCHAYGPVNATGDGWAKLGTFTASGTDDYVFQLSANELSALPSANRPAIMLVPHDNPPCSPTPTTECTVKVDGQTGYVRPPGTLLNQDSLHVMQVTNPSLDSLKQVNYYVDDTLAYTKPTLQPFDWKYVSNNEQTATAIAYYASGQEIEIPQTLPSNLPDNPVDVVGIFLADAWWLRVLVVIGILLLLAWIGFRIIAHYQAKREWEDEHGFTAYEEAHRTEQQWRVVRFRERLFNAAEKYAHRSFMPLVIIVVVVLVIIANNTLATVYLVDGESMERTYMNGHPVLLDKLPVTWARLNHTVFMPKRGQVVVIHAVFGDTTAVTAENDKLVLIKRVIGLPGDHIVVANGHVTIYNAQHPNGFDFDANEPWDATMTPNLPSEHLDLTLSQDEIFVSGDNRPESVDSRFNGPIHINNVIGVVTAKIF